MSFLRSFTPIPLMILLLIFLSTAEGRSQEASQKRQLIRIEIQQKENYRFLKNLNLDLATEKMGQYAEVVATDNEIRQIESLGFHTEILPVDPPGVNVTEYRSYEEVVALCQSYAAQYPTIVKLDTLGYSQVRHLWMPVLKVSDNPDIEEDEPAVLYDGLHHAREPVGMESALYILEHLLTNYGIDDQVTQWVNDYEIFFIPMINPEGYQYLQENDLSSPWWRKNLRDNDDNGHFNPDMDGVDLNRNYDFNWDNGSVSDPSSWTYRGPYPFSESETQGKRDLAIQQKFLLAHTYHSYGEEVLYPWSGWARTPDHDLIQDIASNVASRILSITGNGTYDAKPSDGNTGFSKTWMYGALGAIEFTVETGTQFIPPVGQGMAIARSNLAGGLYLLERMEGPGFTGHVTDAKTGDPLSATVKILGYDTDVILPHTSDSTYGRFWRLMLPGTYSIRVTKDGYVDQTVSNIKVNDSTWTEVNVLLEPIDSGTDPILVTGKSIGDLQLFPNPFYQNMTIKLVLLKETELEVKILDLQGRTLHMLFGGKMEPGPIELEYQGSDKTGHSLATGIYLLSVQTDDETRILRILKTN